MILFITTCIFLLALYYMKHASGQLADFRFGSLPPHLVCSLPPTHDIETLERLDDMLSLRIPHHIGNVMTMSCITKCHSGLVMDSFRCLRMHWCRACQMEGREDRTRGAIMVAFKLSISIINVIVGIFVTMCQHLLA